jgi:hypothetical protein
MKKRLGFNLWYIHNWNLWLDFVILVRKFLEVCAIEMPVSGSSSLAAHRGHLAWRRVGSAIRFLRIGKRREG